MKKALLALAVAAMATSAQAAISGGSHDMTTFGGTLSSCWYCHAPHNTNTAITGAPLWNRTNTSGNITVYSSGTLVSAVQLGANSITCLSCHDGATDLGTMYTGTSEALGNLQAAGGGAYADLGVDLRNDHPVGVEYVPGTGALGDMWATVAAVQAAGLDLYSYGGTFAAYQVECGSCHDPHGTSDGASGGAGFLKAAPADMCTACHVGK
jgi:predicted CXXCH cytochrome family protein